MPSKYHERMYLLLQVNIALALSSKLKNHSENNIRKLHEEDGSFLHNILEILHCTRKH